MTIASIEKVFVEDLTSRYGAEEAASITWLVIGFVCKINRTQYLNNKYNDLSQLELSSFYSILTKLKKGVPVQYVLGETEFYGSVFKVNDSVLIPRPETEELVDWILKDAKAANYKTEKFKVLDIGTGSGCIPITLKKYLSDADIFAIDISGTALKTANENAILNHVDIQLIQDDILLPKSLGGPYKIIVSNPPYVTIAEKGEMHSNVLDYEPHNALFVPDDDPLVFYKAIADFALHNMEKNGSLYLEINEHLGVETLELLKSKGYSNVELRKDLRNKDRMIKARLI